MLQDAYRYPLGFRNLLECEKTLVEHGHLRYNFSEDEELAARCGDYTKSDFHSLKLKLMEVFDDED